MSNQTGTKRSNEVMALERRVAQLEALIKQIPSRFPVGKSSDGASIREKITAANTFAAGDVVYRNGSTWEKAQANAATAARYTGVIESATTTSFVLVYAGKITLAAATLTPGITYYLSDTTAGLAVELGSLTAWELNIPVYRAITATTAIVMSARDVACDLSTLTAGNLTNGGGQLRVNIANGKYFTIDNLGYFRFYHSATAQVQIDTTGKVIINGEIRVGFDNNRWLEISREGDVLIQGSNANFISINKADIVGSGKLIKLRELDVCTSTGTAAKILALCSQEY